MAVKPKVFEFSLALDDDSRVTLEGGEPVELGAEWTPEHLLLAGLARCSLSSLRYYARQLGIEAGGTARAAGRITRRDDGSYGFVAIAVAIEATLSPPPDDVRELLDKAEWGCFIGASLRPKPAYIWRVNGVEV